MKRSTFHSASLIRVNGGGRSHLCLLQPQGHLEGEINHDCDHSSQKAFDVTLSTVAIIRSAFDVIILRCQGVSEAWQHQPLGRCGSGVGGGGGRGGGGGAKEEGQEHMKRNDRKTLNTAANRYTRKYTLSRTSQ